MLKFNNIIYHYIFSGNDTLSIFIPFCKTISISWIIIITFLSTVPFLINLNFSLSFPLLQYE